MEALITILLLIANGQYTNVKQNEYPSKGTMAVVDRRIDTQFKTAKASYYDQSVCVGRIYGETCKTANGEIFNENDLTVAHRTLEFGTRIEFRYGDRSVIARVNDRGPYIHGREFDFSLGTFNSLSNTSKGIIEVEWKIIND